MSPNKSHPCGICLWGKKKKGQATTLCNIGVNLRLAGEKTLTIA